MVFFLMCGVVDSRCLVYLCCGFSSIFLVGLCLMICLWYIIVMLCVMF